jgi:hypothetical protein
MNPEHIPLIEDVEAAAMLYRRRVQAVESAVGQLIRMADRGEVAYTELAAAYGNLQRSAQRLTSAKIAAKQGGVYSGKVELAAQNGMNS